MFASDREGRGFRIYRTDPETSETWRLEGTGPTRGRPTCRPTAVRSYSSAIPPTVTISFSCRWTRRRGAARIRRCCAPSLRNAAPAEAASPASSTGSRRYSPWRTIAPRYWTPTAETDGDEMVIGAATASNDALGRHVYAVEAGWTAQRAQAGLERVLRLRSMASDVLRQRVGRYRSLARPASCARASSTPVSSCHSGESGGPQSVLGAVHSSTDRLSCDNCNPDGRLDVDADGAPRRMADERVAGVRIFNQPRRGLERRGDDRADARRAGFRRQWRRRDSRSSAKYLPVLPRHGVVAGRLAAASTWGDASVRRVFSASGNGPRPGGLFDSDRTPSASLRGFDGRRVVGTSCGCREPRLPCPDLAARTRRRHPADLLPGRCTGPCSSTPGTPGIRRSARSDIVTSIGAELSLDAVIGYRLPITLDGGRGVDLARSRVCRIRPHWASLLRDADQRQTRITSSTQTARRSRGSRRSGGSGGSRRKHIE